MLAVSWLILCNNQGSKFFFSKVCAQQLQKSFERDLGASSMCVSTPRVCAYAPKLLVGWLFYTSNKDTHNNFDVRESECVSMQVCVSVREAWRVHACDAVKWFRVLRVELGDGERGGRKIERERERERRWTDIPTAWSSQDVSLE